MRFKPYLLVLLFALLSCRAAERSTYSLLQDFSYVSQTGTNRSFAVRSWNISGKRFQALAQRRAGEISFSVRLQRKPSLEFSLSPSHRAAPEIIIERDLPDQRRQVFHPQAGGSHQIDLKDYAQQIVKITFAAKGPIAWIHPVVVQQANPLAVNNNDLNAFRKRHAGDNVLIVLFDAAGASHLGCYGYDKPTTPTIDSLAAKGVLWENAIAQAPWTIASTGCLFTGLYPRVHSTLARNGSLAEEFKTLPEFFREAGYQTALFTSNPNASPAIGFGQGFQHVVDLNRNRDSLDKQPVLASEFIPPVNAWLDSLGDQRFFAYIHFREPHGPFTAPAEFLKRFLSDTAVKLPQGDELYDPKFVGSPVVRQQIKAAYDANLAFADSQLKKIVDHLRLSRKDGKTTIVLLADHGEALWEHDVFGHFQPLYQEATRIPLIIYFPNEPRITSKRSVAVAGTIDLLPTFIDLFSFSRKHLLTNGRSLLRGLFQKDEDDRLLLAQAYEGKAYLLRSSEYAFIHHVQQPAADELYNLRLDPMERQNRIADYPVLSLFFQTELKRQIDQQSQLVAQLKKAPAKPACIDRQTEEQLRALGYTN